MPFLIPHPNLIQSTYSGPNPLTATILVVIDAILEVFFLCLVGWILAKKGIVDSSAKKVLNKLNVTLFTPALLFSKVAFSLSPKLLKELAIIPVGFGIITCLSAGVAFLIGTMFKLKKGQKSFAIACAMFQNSNSLPIALMQSLIGEKMPLMWGDDDSKDQMLGRALSYLVLFSTLGIIVRWSIGVRLLTSAEEDPTSSSSDSEGEVDVNEDSEVEEEESQYFSSISNPTTIESTPLISDGPSSTIPTPRAATPRETSSTRKSIKKRSSGSISFATTSDGTLLNSNSLENSKTLSPSDLAAAEEALTASQIQLLGSIKAGGVLGGVKPNPNRKNSLSQAQKNHLHQHRHLNGNGLNGKKDQKKQKRPRSIFQSFPNTPLPSNRNSVYDSAEEEDESEVTTEAEEAATTSNSRRRRRLTDEEEEWGTERGIGRSKYENSNWCGISDRWVERFESLGRKLARVWTPIGKFFRRVGDFMTVPLWAAVLSLVVACIPPLQSTLNQVEPLKAAIKTAGNCSVPITLVTLGAYFYRPEPTSLPSPTSSSSSSQRHQLPTKPPSLLSRLNPFTSSSPSHPLNQSIPKVRRSRRAEGETKTVLVAVMTRMIIVPLILLPLFGWYCAYTNNVADDPIFVVVACLLIGSPTAITLAQITSSASGEVFEILISRTLFVSYAIMTAPCTIALVMTALYIDKSQ